MVVVELELAVVDTVVVVWDAELLVVVVDEPEAVDAVVDPEADAVVDPLAEAPDADADADADAELAEATPPLTANC